VPLAAVLLVLLLELELAAMGGLYVVFEVTLALETKFELAGAAREAS
jgi:hypothetical protein